MSNITPPVDYTSRDYQSILNDLLAAIPYFLPEWTSQSTNDFGVALVQLFAFQADILNFYADRVANESFLGTCQQPSSAIEIANLINYTPTQAVAAQVAPNGTGLGMALTLSAVASYPVTLPQGTQFSTLASSTSGPIIFETAAPYYFTSASAGQTVLYDNSTPAQPIVLIQGITITGESVGASNGAPNQSFSLYNTPVIANTITIFVDQGLGSKLWREVANLTVAGPTDLVYEVSTDANGITWITFGDGNNGAVPAATPLGAAGITANYRVGGGAAGNVGASTSSTTGIVVNVGNNSVATSLITSLANTIMAVGGQDAESIVEIQQNAPQSITAAGRGVSLQDYAALALEIPTVAKAVATALTPTNISLYIHPSTSVLNTASLLSQTAGLTTQIQNYLANIIGIGATVTVLPPQYLGSTGYVPIAVAITVTALSQYQSTQVQQDVLAALSALFDFSTTNFGQYISLSSVYQAAFNVEGVAYCTVTCLCRYENLTNNTSGSLAGPVGDISCAAYELPVVSDPNLPTTLLQITVTGGS